MGKSGMRRALAAWLLVLSMVVSMLPSSILSQAASGTAIDKTYDYNAMTIAEILATDQPLTWVFAGDSITHNGVWSMGMNSYSEWFEQYLYDIDRRDDSVVLTAWGGADIYDFQTSANEPSGQGAKADPGMGLENMITKYDPDVVFIKLGMNDRGKTQATYEKYYKLMLEGIYEAAAENGKKPKIVLLTPTPLSGETVYNTEEEDNDSVWRFQRYLTGIAQEYGLLLCDLITAFTQEALAVGSDYTRLFYSDSSDGGIHPNAAGQYLIFKTLSKTLGIYDESMPIYQLEYQDMDSAALYVDETYIGSSAEYAGNYDGTDTVDDTDEINKAMPTLDLTDSSATLLASVDFESDNASRRGVFAGGTSYAAGTRVDLTDENACQNPLTLAEAQSLDNEFSVVFRAKLMATDKTNQPVLFLSSNGTSNWNNALSLGVPSTSSQLYYEIRTNDGTSTTERTSSSNVIDMDISNTSVDGGWHTIAVVQAADSFTYYVDGEAVYTSTVTVNSGYSIGEGFESAANFVAHIGSYDAGSAPAYQLKAYMDYYQLYAGALTADQVSELAAANKEVSMVDWSAAVTTNNVWVVAGAEQMSGYDGAVVNRSLFRHMDNVMRDSACVVDTNNENCRDIRMISVAAPGRTVAELNARYDELIARHDHQVFLLLPEVSQVYDASYVHSDAAVANFKQAVQALLDKEKEAGNIRILWTPLASSDEKINGYLTAYAQAVREIASADSTILFFDANKFMNEKMAENEVLKRNWFEDDMYLSPLGALDVAYAFNCCMGVLNTTRMEIKEHDLRLTSDARFFKGDYVRDLIKAGVTVDGTTITVDTTPITEAYPDLTDLRIVLLPAEGTGNYHEGIVDLSEVTEATENNGIYTFEAPCSDPVLAIYGELDGMIYRFKDLSLKVTTDKVIEEKTPQPTEAVLTSLTVVGAPEIGFFKDILSYDVELYQYQRNVQILAEAEDGLTITVNGTEVESGAYSGLIPVEETATVTVKVSGTVNGSQQERTYTLNLTRPEYPDIIITEVMTDGYSWYDANGNDNYELIEIYNASGHDLNLLDYSIGYKKDYPYTSQVTSEGNWPYYFTGNDQAFQTTSGGGTTYTGINQITKYSSYWSDKVDSEPEEVLFPADSTMVIWIKFSTSGTAAGYGKALTYDTLVKALTENAGSYTRTIEIDGQEKVIVPTMDQLVVAEVPKGTNGTSQTARPRATSDTATKNFYLENHGQQTTSSSGTARSWLFILKDTAVQASNGSITEAGDDIISAARFVRPGTLVTANGTTQTQGSTDRLSSVFSYDADRGMSLVKDQAYWDTDTIGQPHTSDEQGYSNLTTFGAIEYWQKPYDFSDNQVPEVENCTPESVKEGEEAAVSLTLTDDTDVRYLELYVRVSGDSDYTKISRDYVLETSAQNGGTALDNSSIAFSYELGVLSGSIEYYGYVEDGNGNQTSIGTKSNPKLIRLDTQVGDGTLSEEILAADSAEGYAVVSSASAGTGSEAMSFADMENGVAPVYGSNAYTAYSVWAPIAGYYNISVKCLVESLTGTAYFPVIVSGEAYQAEIPENLGVTVTNAVIQDAEVLTAEVTCNVFLRAGVNVIYLMETVLDENSGVTDISISYQSVQLQTELIPVTEEYVLVPGDANGDRNVNVIDLVHSKKELETAGSAVHLKAADFNDSGAVEAEDVAKLRSVLVGTAENSSYWLKNSELPPVMVAGGPMFDTLNEAMAYIGTNASDFDSESGATIKLLADVTVDTKITVPTGCPVTVMDAGAACSIVRAESYTASAVLFEVTAGTSLRLASSTDDDSKPRLTVDGNGDKATTTGASSLIRFTGAGSVTIEKGVQMINAKGNAVGQVIYSLNADVKVTINGGRFANNASLSSNGAAVFYLNNGGTAAIKDALFENNSSAGDGTCIWCYQNTVSIDNCTFTGNSSTSTSASDKGGRGSVIHAWNTTNVTITDSTFADNSATGNGGVIRASGGPVMIEGCAFTGNHSDGVGGVMEVTDSAANVIEIKKNTFTANTATGNGGVFKISGGKIAIADCTFTENHSDGYAGVMEVNNTTVDGVMLTGCTFTGNSGTTSGTISVATGCYLKLADCQFSGNVGTNEGNDIRLGGATTVVKLSGKMDVDIFNRQLSKLYVDGSLTAGSDVVVDWHSSLSISDGWTGIDFGSTEIMSASKEYISLGSIRSGTYNLDYPESGTTGVLREK